MEIIHIVLGKANPDRLNGVNKVVYNLATEQENAGKKVQVWGITPNPIHDYPERNFKTILFKASSFPLFISNELKTAIKQNKNAIFHIHGGWIPEFSTIASYMSKQQIKYVLTPHGAYNEIAMRRNSIKKKIYFHLFEKKMLKNAHKVHSIGKSEVDGLVKIFQKTRSFLLPYGFNHTQTMSFPVKNEVFTIGFVGRLDVHTKGLDLLISAFEIFQKQITNSKLWIIGEGEGKAFLEDFIKTNQLKNVEFLGKKFGEEKDMLISKMHVFAHPSRNEGLPSAVLEAASFGTPTIVTQATNVADYVQNYHAGIAIENDNVNELVKAMLNLFEDYQQGAARKYSIGAKRMLNDVFSWPVLVKQFDQLYK